LEKSYVNLPKMNREFKNDTIRILKDWKPLNEVKLKNNIVPIFDQTFPPTISVEKQ